LNFGEIRAQMYAHNLRGYPCLLDWRHSPYTCLKARYYMEFSAVLVWFLQKTPITANMVTVAYVACGFATMILLAVPSRWAVLAAILVAFNKGIFDWSDGALARLRGQCSGKGHILDCYGAIVNDVGLLTGLGLYVATRSGQDLYWLAVPVIPVLYALDLPRFRDHILQTTPPAVQDAQSSDRCALKGAEETPAVSRLSWRGQAFTAFEAILDARARGVDTICAILAMELATDIRISWAVFLFLVFKHIVIYVLQTGRYLASGPDA